MGPKFAQTDKEGGRLLDNCSNYFVDGNISGLSMKVA